MFDHRKYKKEMGKQELQQSDIVEKTGFPQSVVSRYLSGKIHPQPATLQVLAEALGKEYDDFYIDPREKHDVQWHYQQVLKAVQCLAGYDCSDDKRLHKLISKHNALIDGYAKMYGTCLPADDITDDDTF